VSSDTDRQSLAAKFDRHADEEGKILAEYRALSEKLGDSDLGSLVSHILTEEELHHLLLRTMGKWLREPSRQARALPPEATRAELLRLTQTLQRHEEDTIDACSKLQEQLGGHSEDLILTLLDAMVLDSEKHRQLLAVVEKMLQA
jgi:ferritin-like metal-binding protein YciE